MRLDKRIFLFMPAVEFLQQTHTLSAIIIVLSVIVFVLTITTAWLIVALKKIRRRQDILFSDSETPSVEQILQRHSEDIVAMDKEIQELFGISNQLHRLGQKSIHRVGFVRFNPFKDVGSNQSFSLALLDGKNAGVVVSSLHTREGSRVYAKPIQQSQSSVPLTEEEKQAISLAQTPSQNDSHSTQ